jgi:hypothetical protein
LADLAFTFLPLAIIAIMRSALGTFNSTFYGDPEWSFAAIIIYGLATTRILELKVRFQRDLSEKLFALVRFCILGLIASVLSLALSQMNLAGLPVATKGVLWMQFGVIVTGVYLLLLAHWARERYVQQRSELPAGTNLVRYLNYIGEDLRTARNEVDGLSEKMARRSDFDFESPEHEADCSGWARRRTRDIDFLISDLDRCVTELKEARRGWEQEPEQSQAGET